jgi:hypothetical protein
MPVLEEDFRNMRELRSLDWGECAKALSLIFELPSAERGYSELLRFYEKYGMSDNMETIQFLIKKTFHDNDPDVGA